MSPSWIQRINGFRRDCISFFIFYFLVSCLSVFISVLACTPACRCPQIGSSWRLSCRQLGVPSVSAGQDLNCWAVSLTPLPWTSFHFLCKEGLWQGTRTASIYLPWWVPSTLLNTSPVIFYPRPLYQQWKPQHYCVIFLTGLQSLWDLSQIPQPTVIICFKLLLTVT